MPKKEKKGKPVMNAIETKIPKNLKTKIKEIMNGTNKLYGYLSVIVYLQTNNMEDKYTDIIKYIIDTKGMITFNDIITAYSVYLNEIPVNIGNLETFTILITAILESWVSDWELVYELPTPNHWFPSCDKMTDIIERFNNVVKYNARYFIMYLIEQGKFTSGKMKLFDDILCGYQFIENQYYLEHEKYFYTQMIDFMKRCMSEEEYLTYLKNIKSNGLTEWFHPPAGHTAGTKYPHSQLMSYQWPTRIVKIALHTTDKNIWKEIFNMIGTLANNNEKFHKSATCSRCLYDLCCIWMTHYNTFADDDDLYSYFDNLNPVENWNETKFNLRTILKDEKIGLIKDSKKKIDKLRKKLKGSYHRKMITMVSEKYTNMRGGIYLINRIAGFL
jgi:hypothetical protein